jgi:hypothetical protein
LDNLDFLVCVAVDLCVVLVSFLSGRWPRFAPNPYRTSHRQNDAAAHFGELKGLRPMIETYPLEQAPEAYERMMIAHPARDNA